MTRIFFTFPISILSNGITKDSLLNILSYAIWDLHINGKSEYNISQITRGTEDCVRYHLNKEEHVYNHHRFCKVKTSINRDNLWKLIENIEDESEESKTLLLAFLAAKSIVGKKQYCKTNYDMLLSRMAGFEKPQYYTPHSKGKIGKKTLRLPEHLKPYNTRRKRDALRDGISRFHISWWSDRGTRGFYLSNTKTTRAELYRLIHTSQSTSIDEKRRAAKERTIREANLEDPEG